MIVKRFLVQKVIDRRKQEVVEHSGLTIVELLSELLDPCVVSDCRLRPFEGEEAATEYVDDPIVIDYDRSGSIVISAGGRRI